MSFIHDSAAEDTFFKISSFLQNHLTKMEKGTKREPRAFYNQPNHLNRYKCKLIRSLLIIFSLFNLSMCYPRGGIPWLRFETKMVMLLDACSVISIIRDGNYGLKK